MKHKSIFAKFFRAFLFLFCISAFIYRQSPGAATPFIKPAEIHPGMVGVGKTVFHGTKIETFKVVALGVLHNALANTDLILIKIESPYLNGKKIGLVAGMSGSPVYFNGRLAGAIAYGWPFTPEPLAGITPIESMIRAAKEPLNKASGLGSPAFIQVKNVPDSIKKVAPEISGLQSLTLQPLGIPVSVSGFDASGLNRLQSHFPMFQVVPGGSKMTSGEAGLLEPGQSVGAALMEGDLNVVANGTLTYRSGSKILAFGHPFLFLGDVDFPLYESYVHYILPSTQLPFKFASPVKEIGRVSQDRLYAIGGVLGEKAKMIPLEISVTDLHRSIDHHFNVRIIKHPDFTPRLTGLAIEQAISSTTKLMGEATAHLNYELDFYGHPPLHLKNLLFSEQSISGSISSEVLKSMVRVLENDFEKVALSRIKIHVAIEPKISAATIQRVVLNKHRLLPGESLNVAVYLKPYNEKVVRKNFTIQIPSDVQGNVQVGIAGGVNDDQLRKMMQQPLPDPLNVSQIIHQIQKKASDNSLIIRLTFPRLGIHWAGEEFGNLPQPYADLLKAAGSDPIDFHADGTATRYEMPWVVIGTDIQDIVIGTAKEAPPVPTKPRLTPPPRSPELIPGGQVLGTSSPTATPAQSMNFSSNLSTTYLSIPSSNGKNRKSVEERKNPGLEEHKNLELEDRKGDENRKTNVDSLSNLNDWLEGTLKHLAVSADGNLFLGPQTTTLAQFDENVLWSEIKAGDYFYVGTANPGKIYRIDKEKQKTLFFDPHLVGVLSLAALKNGDLLAGTTGGELFWIAPSGKVNAKWKLEENYVWQIFQSNGMFYIATGSPRGKIYTLDLTGSTPQPKIFYTSSQSHITSLYGFGDGKLFAGTANDSLLIEIKENGNSRTLYNFDESAVLALSGTADGKLIIGTSGKGKVYLLNHSDEIQKIVELPDENVTWVGKQEDKILIATGIPARLYAIKPGQHPSLLWDGKGDEQVALKGGNGEKLPFLTSGNNPALLQISSSLGSGGEFLSKIIDAGTRAFWGKLVWHGDIPSGTAISVQSRSGNSPVPDSTWSAWSTDYVQTGQMILSPLSRYIQFKVSLSSMKPEQTPTLEAIRYFWRQENHPPSITVLAPESGDVVGPKSTLRAKIRDRDGDTVKVEAWIENTDPKKKIATKLIPIPKSRGEEELNFPLDMIQQNGHLHLKLAVTDTPSNKPESALSAETVIKDLIYDSTPPTLSIAKVHRTSTATRVEGVATDSVSYVKSVQFRIDGGPWLDTVPEQGIFDSPEVKFSFEIDHGLKAKQIEVKALDAADNETKIKRSFNGLSGSLEPEKASPDEKSEGHEDAPSKVKLKDAEKNEPSKHSSGDLPESPKTKDEKVKAEKETKP